MLNFRGLVNIKFDIIWNSAKIKQIRTSSGHYYRFSERAKVI